MKEASWIMSLLLAFASVGIESEVALGLSSDRGAFEDHIHPSKVAVVLGPAIVYDVPLLQVRRLLEHHGFAYDVVRDTDLTLERSKEYSAIIVLGISQPHLMPENVLRKTVENGTGLIWIGEGLTSPLYPLFGVGETSIDEDELRKICRIDYRTFSTTVFNEIIYPVESAGATVEGFFVDDAHRKIAPAELSYRGENSSGLTHYFAYEVCSWWGANTDVPWLRAYRLQMALEDVLSDHLTIRLAPYPRNLRSAFIVRIEDVDPLHTGVDWLARAGEYLDYHSVSGVPLTVSLIPTYVDPSEGLRVGLEADSAQMLRSWLSDVVIRGGTIVEHGFTHQYGGTKTGMHPEFFNQDKQKWLPSEEQTDRISQGLTQIHSSLGFRVKGFEAPHYLADNDTYIALKKLGFTYVTHNTDTPYFDRYDLAEGLINIPETLGYIPLNPSVDDEAKMMLNMDMLYNMRSPMLFFNHLFEDEALEIGERLLDHALTKPSMWYATTDNLADFWGQRLNAYSKMSVEIGEKINVTLGSSSKAGLTLVLSKGTEIKGVTVNGQPWSVFDGNWVVLPVLPEDTNVLVIDLSGFEENRNQPYGWSITVLSLISSAVLFRALRRGKIS